MAEFELKKVREVFDAAAECVPSERAMLLDQACGADAALRAEVERLLACDDAGEFIEQPALALFDQSASEKTAMEMVGQRIGQYRIVCELGRGGMGVVFFGRSAFKPTVFRWADAGRNATGLVHQHGDGETRLGLRQIMAYNQLKSGDTKPPAE